MEAWRHSRFVCGLRLRLGFCYIVSGHAKSAAEGETAGRVLFGCHTRRTVNPCTKTKARTALLSSMFSSLEHETSFNYTARLFAIEPGGTKSQARRDATGVNNGDIPTQEEPALLVRWRHRESERAAPVAIP